MLNRLIHQVQDPTNEYKDVTLEEHIDDSVHCFQSLINLDNPEWRKDVRNEIPKEFQSAPNESTLSEKKKCMSRMKKMKSMTHHYVTPN